MRKLDILEEITKNSTNTKTFSWSEYFYSWWYGNGEHISAETNVLIKDMAEDSSTDSLLKDIANSSTSNEDLIEETRRLAASSPIKNINNFIETFLNKMDEYFNIYTNTKYSSFNRRELEEQVLECFPDLDLDKNILNNLSDEILIETIINITTFYTGPTSIFLISLGFIILLILLYFIHTKYMKQQIQENKSNNLLLLFYMIITEIIAYNASFITVEILNLPIRIVFLIMIPVSGLFTYFYFILLYNIYNKYIKPKNLSLINIIKQLFKKIKLLK